MFDMGSLGKTLILAGLFLIVIGAIFMFGSKISWFGKLPGDIYVNKKNFTFFFPLTTSIVISMLLSIIITIFLRRR